MSDIFMPNPTALNRATGAPSYLGFQTRIGEVFTMPEYEIIGKTRERDLHYVVANGVPDSTMTTDESAVSKAPNPRQPSVWYDAFGTGDVYKLYMETNQWAPEPDWRGVLLFDPNDTGLDMNANLGAWYRSLTVENTKDVLDEARRAGKPVDGKGRYPVEIACDVQGKYISTLLEFRDHDWAQGSQRLPINELTWQMFELAVRANNTSNLQIIYIVDVRNNGFQIVLENAHADKNRPIDKPAVWTRGDEPHFSRLLGTQSISGKMLQLTNHHEAVGNKRIAKIITASRYVKNAANQNNGELTVALVLEPIPECDLAPLRMSAWTPSEDDVLSGWEMDIDE